MEPVRVLITGAAGQIAYSLILQIGKGDVFGPNQPIILHLLDIPPMMGALQGVVMEIEDCALPLVQSTHSLLSFWTITNLYIIKSEYYAGVVATDDLEKAFKGIEAAFLVGAVPRKQGMERKDLLSGNVKIFKTQVR